ncbi:MAG: GvpL/GvpF family gas vesicle protein [Methanotrichaceae archaeon]
MIDNSKFRELIAGMVREEIKAMAEETNNIVADVVKAELMPGLRAAIRESIAKELGYAKSDGKSESYVNAASNECATFEGRGKEKAEKAVSSGELSLQASTAMEAKETIDAGDDQGLYLYGLADTSVSARLGKIGIDGCEVYTIPHEGISAIVHNSPLEPYKSDDNETVKIWVKAHQLVMDTAAERFGNIMPFSFDTIIVPKDNATSKEVLQRWLSDEHDEIMRKMDKIKGKKEYGIQIFYIPSVFGKRIEQKSEEVGWIKEEMASKPPGLAYMYKQKLENVVKTELNASMDTYFKDFYEKIRTIVDDIKVEKVKKADDNMVMMMNLSVLAGDQKALGLALDEIESEEGISVHFTGPWQPYSFV